MKTKNLILTAFFITLGVLIPFTTAHAFGVPGTVLLPMHIPVLLCGLMLGAREGLICGIVTPIISSLLTNMPSVYPMLPIMAGELGTYGVVSGLVYGHCEEKISNFRRGNPASLWLLKVTGLLRRVAPRNDVLKLYIALILAMICGRVVYGLIYSALLLAGEHSSPLRALSVWGAVSTGVIGIIIQLILIPPLVRGLTKASPYSIIRQGDASFIIRRDQFVRFFCTVFQQHR